MKLVRISASPHIGRKQPVFPRQRKGADHIRHIAPQHAHDLHAFFILTHIFRRAAVHHRPILAGRNRHAADGENSRKAGRAWRSCRARPLQTAADFWAHLAAAGIEHAIQERGDAAARRRVKPANRPQPVAERILSSAVLTRSSPKTQRRCRFWRSRRSRCSREPPDCQSTEFPFRCRSPPSRGRLRRARYGVQPC